ncbi:GIY-YIG nuclease family protein [Sphingomonas sp. BK345]|uniref:GIY-YIG nuclease family protein n=1 Tax=Sphingomonas sp. BK345 TaxID=2586980 RepID=UPI0039067ABF
MPDKAGCYVLTTFDGTVLYVGLSVSLRRRMGEHLDSPSKVALTAVGKAVWFYWLVTPETNKVERTWLNMHLVSEGKLPVLNNLYSPTST